LYLHLGARLLHLLAVVLLLLLLLSRHRLQAVLLQVVLLQVVLLLLVVVRSISGDDNVVLSVTLSTLNLHRHPGALLLLLLRTYP
jgi:hypothetical protein